MIIIHGGIYKFCGQEEFQLIKIGFNLKAIAAKV